MFLPKNTITILHPILLLLLLLLPTTTALPFTMSTSSTPKPNLPLPPPLDSQTLGTWSYDTMTRRIDSEILQRTYDENKEEFTSPEFVAAMVEFNALREELRNAGQTKIRHLRPLPGQEEELSEWRDILTPFIDSKQDTWLSAPWMVAEFYLYRRVLEALGYFDPMATGTVGYDPFAKQKRLGLVQSLSLAGPILEQMKPFLDVDTTANNEGDDTNEGRLEEGMGLAVAFDLWGNKMDLSLWPADASQNANMPGMFDAILRSADDNLLHDDTDTLLRYVKTLRDTRRLRAQDDKPKPIRVDIIVDNAGFELIMDLVLADYLIASGIADVVRFQLKAHPTFVSDAMEKDLREHINYYANGEGDGDAVTATTRQAGTRWNSYLDSGKWQCHEHNFWVQPPPMWAMPPPLRTDLTTHCDLAFVKGDANYRRLLGDLAWDLSNDGFEDVVGAYFPCPVCALRTLKAEVGCGMEKALVDRAKGLDEGWSVNGRFGVVQFSMGVGGGVVVTD